MRKPELRITENTDGIPTRGICSSCPAIVFSTSPYLGTEADNRTALELQFTAHFNQVHLLEDDSQDGF